MHRFIANHGWRAPSIARADQETGTSPEDAFQETNLSAAIKTTVPDDPNPTAFFLLFLQADRNVNRLFHTSLASSLSKHQGPLNTKRLLVVTPWWCEAREVCVDQARCGRASGNAPIVPPQEPLLRQVFLHRGRPPLFHHMGGGGGEETGPRWSPKVTSVHPSQLPLHKRRELSGDVLPMP